jgi:hypothetical protein
MAENVCVSASSSCRWWSPTIGAGLTRYATGAGFPLHGHLPSELGPTVGSTGVLRLPATLGDVLCERGEVAGGIQVPVEPEPAGLAGKGALRQGELGFTQPQAEHVLDEG